MKYQIKHETYASVIGSIETAITSKGYELPTEFANIGFWGNVAYNETKSENIQLVFNEGKKHINGIAFQVYRSNNGTYELNMYFWN